MTFEYLRSATHRFVRTGRGAPAGWRSGSAVMVSAVLAASAWLAPMTVNAAASAIEVIHSFDDPAGGQYPDRYMQLVEHNGAFYGATQLGNEDGVAGAGCGTLFSITAAGVLQTLYYPDGRDGCTPKALTVGPGGHLYGVMEVFGARPDINSGLPTAAISGTIFRITTGGEFTRLHSFETANARSPIGGLLFASDSSLYGTTTAGAATGSGFGTVFRATVSGDEATVAPLHNFAGGSSGGTPMAALIEDANTDGVFYGTTLYYGSCGAFQECGTVFRVNSSGGFQVLRSFTGSGETLTGPVVQGADGLLYGMTTNGGANGDGTVFRVGTNGTGYTVLHSFNESEDQLADPAGGLIVGDDGNLYGVAGGVFGLNPETGRLVRHISIAQVESVVSTRTFQDSIRGPALSGVVQGSDGNLYGTSTFGGTGSCAAVGESPVGCGTVFRVVLGEGTPIGTPADPGPGGDGTGGGSSDGGGGGGAVTPGLLFMLLAAAALRRRQFA